MSHTFISATGGIKLTSLNKAMLVIGDTCIQGFGDIICYNQYRMYVISVLQNCYQAVKDGINT